MEEEGILKQGANVALGALETYGKGVDYLNDQVSLRTLQQSQNPALGLVNKFISKAEPEWLTNLFDYSYKDLRDDVSEGVGWTAKKVTGSETAGNVAELGTQILLPDAVDFAAAGLPIGAAGKLKFLNVFKRGSKTANKYVDATAIVSKVNPSKLNDLKAFSFATKVDNLTGGNVKSEVMQMLSTNPEMINAFTKTSTTYKGLQELAPAYSKAKKAQVQMAKQALLEGKPRPAFWNPQTQSIWKFESKGKGKWSAFNTDNKILRGAKRVNLAKGKYITLDDMVKELGPELGQKAFEINETKLKKLYRWVSKEGAQLDHISPVSRSEGGYLVYTNLILLKAKDNIAKGNKILPKAILDELGVPLSKEAAIRSILKPTSTLTTKQKRVKILRELGIWKEVK